MVTTKLAESFIPKKVSDEDVNIVTEEGNLSAMKDGIDMTSHYEPSELTRTVVDVFGMNVEEAVDFSEKLDDFREEGRRSEVSDSKKRTVEKYRESYGSNTVSEIVDNLRVPDKFSLGKDVWNFLETAESDILAEDAEAEIDEILEAESGVIQDDIEEKLDGEYQKAAEEAYEGFEDDISEVAGLAEISDYEPGLDMFDTFKWLKGKQKNPNWQDEIDIGDLKNRLQSEIETQRRRKTLDTLKSQARELARQRYENITGEEPEEVGRDELYAVRAHMMTDDSEDLGILEDIIEYGEDVYFQESSPSHDKIGNLENAEFEVLKDGLGREEFEIDDREFEIYVASPMEALRYGDEFDTCHSITWDEEFSAQNSDVIRRSASLTSPVIYVEDNDGEIVGRDRMYLDEGEIAGKPIEKLSTTFKFYTGLENQEVNSELKDSIKDYQERMRIQIGYITEEKRSDVSSAIIESDSYDEWQEPEYV